MDEQKGFILSQMSCLSMTLTLFHSPLCHVHEHQHLGVLSSQHGSHPLLGPYGKILRRVKTENCVGSYLYLSKLLDNAKNRHCRRELCLNVE